MSCYKELGDEGIEKVSVEASEAFSKFQGKTLDGSAIGRAGVYYSVMMCACIPRDDVIITTMC